MIIDARVILMCGVSGSGKTVFSKKLERYGYVRLSVDEIIWNEYGLDFNAMPDSQRAAIFQQCGQELESRLTELLETGERVVVDSTMCKRAKRDRIREICSSYGVVPIFVYLSAPYDILRERLKNRKGTGPDDLIVEDRQLREYCSNFEQPLEEENVVALEQSEL